MKILRVEEFECKKNDEKTSATSPSDSQPAPENSKESKWVEEKSEGESTDVHSLEKPENVADPDGALRDEPPEHLSKAEQLTGDGQELQAFFENIQYDNPEQHLPDEQMPNEELFPKDIEPAYSLNGGRQRKLSRTILQGNQLGEAQKSSNIGVMSNAGQASGKATRSVDLRPVSKPEDKNEEKPKRRQRDSGGGGGDITEPPRFSLRDVFHIIFKRKLQILICFIVIVSIAAVGTFLMKPVYEASTQILVKLGRESVFTPTAGNVAPILNINREEQVNSEIEIIKSRTLAEKVVTAIGPSVLYKSLAEEKSGILNRIMPDRRREMTPDERKAADFESAIARFMKALDVMGIKKSNVIQVSFKHQDPQMASMVVNKLANMYLDQHLAVHKTAQNVKFFQEQTDLLKNKFEQTEDKLKALKKQHNITSLEQQRTLLLGQSSDLNTTLNQTISEEVETEKRIRQLRKQLESVPQTISQGVENDQNPYLMNTLEARLVELQLKEKELLTKYTDESRLVQNVKEEIQVVQLKLKEQESKSYGSRTSAVNPTYQRLKEELLSNEAEIEALKAKKNTQKEHLADLQVQLENLNQVELELKELEQQIEVDRENYRLYLTKVEESRISDAMDTEKIASVSVIGLARPPQKPVSPKVILNILIGIFLGIFGSLSLALFREYLDDRIEKIEDIEKELHLPVLATIPVFDKKAAGLRS